MYGLSWEWGVIKLHYPNLIVVMKNEEIGQGGWHVRRRKAFITYRICYLEGGGGLFRLSHKKSVTWKASVQAVPNPRPPKPAQPRPVPISVLPLSCPSVVPHPHVSPNHCVTLHVSPSHRRRLGTLYILLPNRHTHSAASLPHLASPILLLLLHQFSLFQIQYFFSSRWRARTRRRVRVTLSSLPGSGFTRPMRSWWSTTWKRKPPPLRFRSPSSPRSTCTSSIHGSFRVRIFNSS